MAKQKADASKAEAPAAETAAPAEKITQRVAVARALTAGKDKPVDAVPYIKEQFGITLTNQNFSTIKSQINKAAGASKPKGRPTASANGTAHPRGGSSANGAAVNPADLARAVKALVTQYGAEAVKGMADVFAE